MRVIRACENRRVRWKNDGGWTTEIARDPADIRVGDVVRRTEGSLALVECFARATNTCPLTPACGLKGALREAFDAFFTSLDRWTVADLVAAPRWTAQVYKLGRPA